MNVKIASERENPIIGRKEIWAVVRAGCTPMRSEIKTRLAAELGTEKDLIVVDKIKTATGSSDVEVYVKVYADEESKRKVELKHKIERNKVVDEDAENKGDSE